jgi:hypothetical protein
MEGNQVICVACGVHIFIPSIGKAGGCNPVPIDNWRNDERADDPRRRAGGRVNYFSTVMTIKVTDPVDKTTLTNTSAEYKYSWAAKPGSSRPKRTITVSAMRQSSSFPAWRRRNSHVMANARQSWGRNLRRKMLAVLPFSWPPA